MPDVDFGVGLRADPYLENPVVDPLEMTTDPAGDGLMLAERCDGDLAYRADQTRLLRGYYEGEQRTMYATKKWRETFGRQFGEATDNWCQIVIDSATNRMEIDGWKGPHGQAAWDLWRRGGLDVEASIAHTDALVTGTSYLLVSDDGPDSSTVTVEDPLQTTVIADPANWRRRKAGYKRWIGDDGRWRAVVMTDTHVVHLKGRDRSAIEVPGGWEVEDIEENALGVVPIIPLVNRPDVYRQGVSDLAPMVPLQDQVNKLLGDMLIASEFAAFRQRVLIGVEVPTNPATGQPDQGLVGGINRWLAIEDENAKVQELEASDLSNYTKPVEMLVKHIAAITRTPPHYLIGDMVNVSGDALAAAESGLVTRVRRAQSLFGRAWAEALSLALRLDRTEAISLEPEWRNPERISDAQLSDALLKQSQIGVPRKALWEQLTSREEVERWGQMDRSQAELDAVATGISGPSGLPADPPDGF